MKALRWSIGMTLLVLLLTVAVRAADGPKDEVTKLSQAYDAAIKDRDEKKLGQLLDDDGRYVNDEGRLLDKKGYIADFVKDKTYESSTSTDVTVRMVGGGNTTAIQTGTWTAKGTMEGKPFQKKSRFTTVWVKTGDTWVVTAEQSTPITGDR